MVIVGIDEVGRGCWAGPLVAAAVALQRPIEGLNDSKVLSKTRREQLYVVIRTEALAIGLGWVWPEAIDSSGITQAVKSAMQQAVAAIQVSYDQLIIDGNINYFANDKRAQAIIKADGSVPAVSAASIVAKVARDAYMAGIAADYPQYGFEHHVGYGTGVHIAALKKHGVSSIHRRSFKPIKALLELK